MIQVINRALDILEFVAGSGTDPVTLTAITRATGLKPGTCANIVKTLTMRNYLEKIPEQKGYRLGNQALHMSSEATGMQRLVHAAGPVMSSMTAALHESTLLAILERDNRKVIHRCDSSQLVQAHTPDEKKAYDSSTGRLLVALLPDAELQHFIQQHGLPSAAIWPDAHTKTKFLQQVAEIRKNGYALIEDSVQIVGIALPVYVESKVVAGLSVYVPSFRFTPPLRKKMLRVGLQSARKITAALSSH